MSTTTMNKPPTAEAAYQLLIAGMKKNGALAESKVQSLARSRHGVTIEDYHTHSTDSDETKLSFYRECVRTFVAPQASLAAASAAPAPTPAVNDLFQQLCSAVRAAGGDAHKKVSAHLRAVTGKTVALAIYHQDSSIPAADKAQFYANCINAVKSKDWSKLKGEMGKGDKRVDDGVDAGMVEEPVPTPATLREETDVRVVTPEPIPEDTTDPVEAALLLLKKARSQPKFDEASVRRICEGEVVKALGTIGDTIETIERGVKSIRVPTDEDILGVLRKAMSSGEFPEHRVLNLIESAIKKAAPTFDIEAIVKPKVTELLSQSLSDYLKRGPAALAPAPKLVDTGELASTVPKTDPTYVVTPQMKAFLKYVHQRSPTAPVNVIVVGPHGCGKCLAKGTPVLMFNGDVRLVEEIRVGDLVMGPDSKPRRVTSLARGTENMWKVVPKKGDPYTVNESHILSLRNCDTKKVVNISVADYLRKGSEFKARHQGWRAGVEFAVAGVFTPHVDPWFLGVWLGDGNAGDLSIHKPDAEVREQLAVIAYRYGGRLSTFHRTGKCPRHTIVAVKRGQTNKLLEHFKALGVLGNKHVPRVFKVAPRRVRLEVLAGLMDSDGHLHGNTYDFISKYKQLSDDVVWLARSLGLAAYVKTCTKSCQNGFTGTYHRVSISGNTNEIPCRIKRKRATARRQKKDALAVGIRLDPQGRGEYFGFTLDGPDRLFLLGDFTVTHNTTLAEIYAAEFKKPLLIMDCANIREPRDWFGYKYTEAGSVLWHRSQFDRCMSEGNHVIVLDELPRTTDQIRNVLFPLLDYRRQTYLEERGDFITVGKGTVIFVTANEGMAYTGCSALDLALDDRLSLRAEVNYMTVEQETEVLVKRTGIDRDAAHKLAEIGDAIRSKAIGVGATLTKTVSTRRLIEAADAYKTMGKDGLTYALTNHFTADGGDQSERAQVLLMVGGKFKS